MPLRDFKEVIIEFTGDEVWSFVESYLETDREKYQLILYIQHTGHNM